MHYRNIFLISILLFFLAPLTHIFTANYNGLKISKISFEGNQTARKELLRSLVSVQVGDSYNDTSISESVTSIFELGYFSEIKVDVVKEKEDSVAITFLCKELPVIKKIKYEGNKKIQSSTFDEEVIKIVPESPQESRIYSLPKINEIKGIIRAKYIEDGYLETTIDVREDRNEKDNTVDVTFIIDEGAKTIVRKIKITGNAVFTEKKLLSRIETKAKDIIHGGVFDEMKYAMDKEKIIEYYKNNGYIKAAIIEDTVITNVLEKKKGKTVKESKELDIYIKVFEGIQYSFAGYTVNGYTIFPEKTVWSALKHKKGSIFNSLDYQKDMMTLQQLYAGRGYIFAQVIPDEKIDNVARTISFDILIYEGEIAHVENIIVRGNTKTKEYVIRRELSISEGDIFDADKIRRSQEKIYNLGFFKDVKLDVRPGSAEGLMNLVIDVEEQQTGMITLGATYSVESRFGGYEEISENNFLGRGFRINEKIEFQQARENYTVGFSTPWVLGTPTSFSFNIYYRNITSSLTNNSLDNTNISWKERQFGSSIGLGRRISDYVKTGGSYEFLRYSYDRIGKDVTNTEIKPGAYYKNTFLLYFEFDSRDNIFNPSKGRYFRQTALTSFGLNGNNDTYNKYTTEAGLYFPTFWKLVLIFHGYFGTIQPSFIYPDADLSKVKLEDQFTLGSPETVRGYQYDKPWSYRGFSQIYFNVEYRFPIVEQLLWGLVYMDTGNQWDSPNGFDLQMQGYAYSLGLGFRVQIPMLPLRFYLSYPFSRDDDKGWHFKDSILKPVFEFSVGGLF